MPSAVNSLRSSFFACALSALAGNAFAHGGMYRGPGASVPPIGGGGTPAVLPAPGSTGAAPATGGPATNPGGDLTHWSLWWRLNHAPYLALKTRVHSNGVSTGLEGWFLGDATRRDDALGNESTLRPSESQIRGQIVPALLAVLEREGDNDLVTGALIALAKVGEGEGGRDGARIEAALTRFLSDASQEVRETAAVALGILASPRSIPSLANLLWDTPSGRKQMAASEVNYRTRSFAAYGLGLIGARTASEHDRKLIVSMLRRALERDDTRSRDLEVACLLALGLVPLATIETPLTAAGAKAVTPESSRLAQLDFVLALLCDEERENLARAQCPVTLARLLVGLPEPHHSRYRAEVVEDLIARLAKDKDRAELLQSCILGLGALGTNDGKNPLDARIRRTLTDVTKDSDPLARGLALIAAAEVGARLGQDLPSQGVDEMRALLVHELAWGKSTTKPWAGLASGVLCYRLTQQGSMHPAILVLQKALSSALEDERSPEQLGAYALGAGLARSSESAPRLMKLLAKDLQEDARGQVALGLGLLGYAEAIELLREAVGDSKYRPEVLRQGAIALGLLGDKEIATQLASMLKDARSLAAQAAIASALGFIGDRRSVDPLLALLSDQLASEKARAFAAVALGNVADKELLPWNAKIGLGGNYGAAPATLFDPASGTGILDIF